MSEPDNTIIVVSDKPISQLQLFRLAGQFNEFVKAVVDVERRVVAFGGELHSDAEQLLSEAGSKAEHLWGINIYVDRPRSTWIEFDSMINIRPRLGNRSRSVESASVRELIYDIVDSLIE